MFDLLTISEVAEVMGKVISIVVIIMILILFCFFMYKKMKKWAETRPSPELYADEDYHSYTLPMQDGVYKIRTKKRYLETLMFLLDYLSRSCSSPDCEKGFVPHYPVDKRYGVFIHSQGAASLNHYGYADEKGKIIPSYGGLTFAQHNRTTRRKLLHPKIQYPKLDEAEYEFIWGNSQKTT